MPRPHIHQQCVPRFPPLLHTFYTKDYPVAPVIRLGLVKFEVGASSGVVCANLGQSLRLWVLLIVSVSFSVPHFRASAWHLKCTKHVGCNSSVVQ